MSTLYARLRGGLLAALAPVVAAALTLGGLSAWVAAGAAGGPARISVTDGRVFLPYGSVAETAAFFRITNSGDSDDVLESVRSPQAVDVMLSRTVEREGANVESMRMVESATVPAGRRITMKPDGLDVMLRPERALRLGAEVPFVLRFRHSGEVRVTAVVVRPGS
ncbi:copper chaperone PCu(A)C [Streptomyces spectabilis]|uniref:Copper chaperone PCu(A)C n=1 Tax=Streptomyces spectabilis TaxID=68270 RepID=A0A516REV4_STRST|nr:copper chaperone PCu(A)C [Streptomyces spectabilis]QDQ14190.1 copper chaperone PCu(A)C [Streptomyces spectabilis]